MDLVKLYCLLLFCYGTCMNSNFVSAELEIVADPYDALPCALMRFTINDQKADVDDFGSTDDLDPDIAEEYGCGNRQFVAKMPPPQSVLDKYNINEDEYRKVINLLSDVLSVGGCGWCI